MCYDAGAQGVCGRQHPRAHGVDEAATPGAGVHARIWHHAHHEGPAHAHAHQGKPYTYEYDMLYLYTQSLAQRSVSL